MATTVEKNKIGLWTSASLVIGNMIGAGFFLMPAALAAFGAIGLVGWVVSAIGAILLATVFSNLSKLMPQANGGPYAYTRSGFGDFAGFLVAWGYWISIWTANATIAVAFVGALSTFFPVLGTHSGLEILTGLAAIWLLTWINSLGIRKSGLVQRITTLLKLLPIVAIAIVGLFYVRWQNFIPFNLSSMSGIQAIVASAAMTFFAFTGVESATIPSQSVINPQKTIPRATMLGTTLTTILYILGTVSVMGIIPAKSLQRSLTPLADAAVTIWGEPARYWFGAGVAVAAFGALNGWILLQGQVPYAIAKDKLFPALFARLNKKGAPAMALIISSVLMSVFMAMNFTKGLVEQFRFMLLIATLSALIPYLFVAASYVILMSREKKVSNSTWFRTLVAASLSFAFSFLAIMGSGKDTVFWGFVLLLAGIPFYVWIVWKKNQTDKSRL
jgi:basic amino acid/polyamine antiporter, APA family